VISLFQQLLVLSIALIDGSLFALAARADWSTVCGCWWRLVLFFAGPVHQSWTAAAGRFGEEALFVVNELPYIPLFVSERSRVHPQRRWLIFFLTECLLSLGVCGRCKRFS
jgi:hypothetical protein